MTSGAKNPKLLYAETLALNDTLYGGDALSRRPINGQPLGGNLPSSPLSGSLSSDDAVPSITYFLGDPMTAR
ncbi:hypothetical protein FHT71_003053 [Rhizobium sp. BK060]|nr:hypothetical protein [Rhizobium sp. BK060]